MTHTKLILSSLALAATVTLVPSGAARAADEAPAAIPNTLGECIALAIKKNPDVVSADYEIEANIAQQKSARGNYFPKLHADAGVQVWDKPLKLSLGGSRDPNGPQPPDIACRPRGVAIPNMPDSSLQSCTSDQNLAYWLDSLYAGFSKPTPVRNQITWSAGVTISQPITPLWTIDEGVTLRKLGVDVARIGLLKTRRDIAYQVTEAYYRLIQAMEMEEIAAKSVEQVGAQVQKAEAFFKNGMVGRNDLLRAQLGLASANQRLIQARGGVTLARGRLATLLGLPPDTAIKPSERVTQPPAAPAFSPQQAEDMALGERVEFREVNVRIEQAQHNVQLNKSKLIPQVAAVANYTHSEGSAFAQKNAMFAGLNLSWDVWDWGATYFGIDEAKTRVKQAVAARAKAADLIRLEVRSAYVNVSTAAQALEVARQAVTQAEENYRIEQKRYEAANNTSFDVLDAETQLTNARAGAEAALYEYVIAESNLQRAVGRLPEQVKVKS